MINIKSLDHSKFIILRSDVAQFLYPFNRILQNVYFSHAFPVFHDHGTLTKIKT